MSIAKDLSAEWSSIITEPSQFFAKAIIRKKNSSALFFGMFITGISLLFFIIKTIVIDWDRAINNLTAIGINTTKIELINSSIFVLFFFPLLYILISYSGSYIFYAINRIVSGIQGKDNFNIIFKIVNYSFAAAIFSLCPLVGFFITIVLYTLISYSGIKTVFNLSLMRTLNGY